MNIQFSEQFQSESAVKLSIKKDSAQLAVRHPDKHEKVQVGDDLTLLFFYKVLPKASNNLSLLVYGISSPNGDLNLVRGFKIYPDLCQDFASKRPTQLLMELANRFGFQITIGTNTEFFFFHQTLNVDIPNGNIGQPNDLFAKVIKIHAKKGREFTSEFLMKHHIQGNTVTIDCALVYTIDLDDYRKWILQH